MIRKRSDAGPVVEAVPQIPGTSGDGGSVLAGVIAALVAALVRSDGRRDHHTRPCPPSPPAARDFGVELSAVANLLQVVTEEAVVIYSTPQIGLSGGAHTGTEFPTSMSIDGPRQFTLTYANNVANGDEPDVAYHDPTVRSCPGGYMKQPTGAIPASSVT